MCAILLDSLKGNCSSRDTAARLRGRLYLAFSCGACLNEVKEAYLPTDQFCLGMLDYGGMILKQL